MRIDSHHSFSERYPLAHLETILKRNRFDGGILAGPAFWPELDFVKGVVVCADRIDGALLDEYQKQPKFRGICCTVSSGCIPESLAELERRRVPLDLVSDLEAVPCVAERFPELRIVIDHLGFGHPLPDGRGSLGFEEWAERLETAARCPNIFCKLSGLSRVQFSPQFAVRHALAVFGPDRLMFGSDWPNALPEYSWKAALAMFTQAIGPQPISVREELLGGTAARFYAL